MKNFRSLFYTIPAKIVYSTILIIFAFLIAECNMGYFSCFTRDSESFINAMSQVDSFDYENSRYFKSMVVSTVESVVKLSMDYEEVFENDVQTDELLNRYNSIGDTTFTKIYNSLSKMKGFRFALVNHTKKKIYSNIEDINLKSSATDVQKHFGQAGRSLLIVRSCRNPYFATDAFIEYAELIRKTAEKYDDSFDLYISFGTEESFEQNEKKYEQLHFEMREEIEKLNNTLALYIAATVLIIMILLTVTGKHEPGGKTYPTLMNRLPNDVLVVMYSIILICMSSLYRTASTMLFTHGNEPDIFWLARSNDFYSLRIKFCIVVFIYTATTLLCILKREYKMGHLFTNTYIYSAIESARKLKSHESTDEEA